ncbi:unnamed protein product, partial [Gongylonema pulchrum]|uniref:USP domain-containing protein n=1 Tax=Gongylonema pulchrum TaxID=637853 RepID=A0A183EWL6_9BILA
MLIQIPDFVKTYSEKCELIFLDVGVIEAHNDFNAQTAKVFSCLLSGEFSKEGSEYNCIKPTQFRKVVGKDHAEFSTAKQQDADEYLRYFLTKVDENEKRYRPVDAVRLKLEQRLEDSASNRVRYTQSNEYVLSLVVPE